MSRPDVDALLDVLSRVSVGDLEARVETDPDDLDGPWGLLANAVNLLLDDLAYRQQEREDAVAAASEARAKEEILAYLSHDMQTPLALLLGTLNVLETSPTEEELASALPIMRRATTRLQRFVTQFLDLARLGATRPLLVRLAPVELAPIAERVATLFADKGQLDVEIGADVTPVRGDAERVEQILANLVGNAFKYAGPGAEVRIRADAADGSVRLHVDDDGVGMGAEDRARAFARFERGATAAGTSGTGLGLYLSRALAEAQGGTLTVDSRPGEGSRFTLCLPAAT